MSIFDVNLVEPIHPGVTADALQPTVDALEPTADGGLLVGATELSDAVVNANFVYAEIVEPVGVIVTADTTNYTADNTIWPTADGGILIGALDFTDAEVIAATLPIEGGGAYYPRPRPPLVIGHAYGVLRPIQGTAIGIIGVAGAAVAKLPSLSGAATGTAGTAGRGAASIGVLSIASVGTTGTRGTVSGAIVKLNATAIGQHDDEEAAVITLLLAA